MTALSSYPTSEKGSSSSQIAGDSTVKMEQQEMICSEEQYTTTSLEIADLPELHEKEERIRTPNMNVAEPIKDSQTSSPPSIPSLTAQSSDISNTHESPFAITESVLKSFTSTPGYLSNRWNTTNSPSSTPLCSQTASSVTPSM